MDVRVPETFASFRPRPGASAVGLAVLSAIVLTLAFAARSAAQAPTTFTGRVVWCLSPYPYPLMATEGGTVEGMTGEGMLPMPDLEEPLPPESTIAPGMPQIAPGWRLPAGAVLVAIQGTRVMGKTDETGRFTLNGVPAGTYLTVAAGPVASVGGASAVRPNAFVEAGKSADLGTLVLTLPTGAGCSVGGYRATPGMEPGPSFPSDAER